MKFTVYSIEKWMKLWHGSEYVSVFCYSLFGKIEDANKIDLFAV